MVKSKLIDAWTEAVVGLVIDGEAGDPDERIWSVLRSHGLTCCESVGVPRSGSWPAVRDRHLDTHPACAGCGNRHGLDVHHLEPFHVEPARELDPANLITLCRPHCCHLMLGHGGNWTAWNPHARADAARLLRRIAERKGAGA